MSYLKYWLFRRLVYFLLTTAMLQTNRKSPNVEKNKGVNFTENSPIFCKETRRESLMKDHCHIFSPNPPFYMMRFYKLIFKDRGFLLFSFKFLKNIESDLKVNRLKSIEFHRLK